MLVDIIKTEGVASLYSGIVPSLILTTNPAIQFVAFDRIKAWWMQHIMTPSSDSAPAIPSAFALFLMGAYAKTLATIITYPYIMAKMRLQWKASSTSSTQLQYTGTVDVLRKIVASKGAYADIIETYASLNVGNYLTNAVTEIVLKEQAKIQTCRIQKENEESFHIAATGVRCERDSSFTLNSVDVGAALSRNDIRVDLDAEGSECVLNGLYMVSGSQHVDNNILINHAKPHCTSRQLYIHVLWYYVAHNSLNTKIFWHRATIHFPIPQFAF